MSKKVSDLVRWTTYDDVRSHLGQHAVKLRALIASIEGAVERTNERDVLTNLAKRTASEFDKLASTYPAPIEGVAWCSRNLFELNLLFRYVLLSPKNVDKWLGQAAGDEIQVIQGLLTLATDGSQPHVKALKDRWAYIDGVCKKHSIDLENPIRIDDLAKQVGRTEDYKALYKLFSKYVHPSSWLINNSKENIENESVLNAFLIQGQLCGLDTHGRLEHWFKSKRPVH